MDQVDNDYPMLHELRAFNHRRVTLKYGVEERVVAMADLNCATLRACFFVSTQQNWNC